VGRERELRELDTLLTSHRLITLTGLGGSGKTRLAAELWKRHQPDAWFISLSDLNDPSSIPEAIRQGLRLPSSANRPALEHVADELGSEQGILILDNFEHLINGSPLVGELLKRCHKLRIVVTSQLVLGLPDEVEYAVGPLGLATLGSGTLSESMVLFEERCRAVVPSFSVTNENLQSVEELCRRLDGFPLALEIAAAKSRVFAPSEMLAQLEDRFTFLTRRHADQHNRHRSLHTALDWSFDRLSEPDQQLLTELSVFRGGFTLDAVGRICEGSTPPIPGSNVYPITSKPDSGCLSRFETTVQNSFPREGESNSQKHTQVTT
jgi:predicted ATPase